MSLIKNKYFLFSIISAALITNFIYSFKADICIDPMLDKILASNKTHFRRPDAYFLKNKNYIYHANEILDLVQLKGKRDFFKELSFYYKNYGKISDHAPIFSTLARIPIIRSLDLWGYRLLNFLFFIFSLFALNALAKELLFSKEARYLSLILLSISLMSQQLIMYGRMYTISLFFSLLSYWAFIKIIRSQSKNSFLTFSFIFLTVIHACFLTYFFYAAFFPAIFIGLVLYILSNLDSYKVQKLQIFWASAICFFSVTSLGLYSKLTELAMSHTSKSRAANLFHYDAIPRLKASLINFTHICIPDYLEPYNFYVLALFIIFALFQKELKKILPLFFITISVPISIHLIDIIFHGNSYGIIRYFLAAFPFAILIQALCFSKKPKLLLFILVATALITNIFPQTKNQSIMYHHGGSYLALAKTKDLIKEGDYKGKRILIVPSLKAASYFIFLKYFLEIVDDSSPIFEQKTKESIYMATNITSSSDIFSFIIRNKIEKVLFIADTFTYSKETLKRHKKLFELIKKKRDNLDLHQIYIPQDVK